MKVRLFWVLFIMAVLAGITDREASAYKVKVEVEKTGAYAEKISDEMFEFARKETISCIKEYVENEDGFYDNIVEFVGMDVTKEVAKRETFILCKPYVYWTPQIYLFPAYVFPVAVNGKIVSLLEVSGRIEDSDFICAMLKGQGNEEEIESLNKLDYLHKDYVFFYYQEKKMAADENGEIRTVVKSFYLNYLDKQASSRAEEAFYAVDYGEKRRAVLEQMDNFMYQEELEAFMEQQDREFKEWLRNGGELIVKGTGGQVTDGDAVSPEPDSTKTGKQDGSDGRNLPVAASGGVVTLVLVVCIVVMMKKR